MIGQRFITQGVRWKRAAASVAASLVAAGCMHLFASPPPDLDNSRTRLSEHGVYRVTIAPQVDTIRVGRMHSWKLHVETGDAQPVNDASVAVGGGMPQHGHGLPTKPRVTQSLGNGDHLVEGMKFNMGGWWVVTFKITAPAGTDSVTFNLTL
jgi:hypothetical protein